MLTFELVVTTTSFPLGVQTAYKSFLATGKLVVILALLVSQNLAKTQFKAYSGADANCIRLFKQSSELDVTSEDGICSQGNVSKFLSLHHTNGMLLVCIATAVQL